MGEEFNLRSRQEHLTKIAAKSRRRRGIDDPLVGPSALAFVDGDIVVAAKSLKTFAKENPHLSSGRIRRWQVISGRSLLKLAELESRGIAGQAGWRNKCLAVSGSFAVRSAPVAGSSHRGRSARQGRSRGVPVAAAAPPAADEAPAEEAPEQEAPAATDETPEAARSCSRSPSG